MLVHATGVYLGVTIHRHIGVDKVTSRGSIMQVDAVRNGPQVTLLVTSMRVGTTKGGVFTTLGRIV